MQPSLKRQLLTLGLLSIAILGTFLWEWPYSPVHKTIAWVTLKQQGQVSAEQVTKAITVFLNGKSLDSVGAITLPYLAVQEETVDIVEVAEPYNTSIHEDPAFVEEMRYTFPSGIEGVVEREVHILTVEGKKSVLFEIEGKRLRVAMEEVVYAGLRPQDDLKKEFLAQWKTVGSALKSKKIGVAESLLSASEVELFSKTAKVSDLDYRLAPTASIAFAVGAETQNTIQIATLTLQQKNCTKKGSISIIYLKDQRSYRFDNVNKALSSMCAKPKPTVGTLTCSNCWLAPVGKPLGLPSGYAPYVVYTGLNGGGYVTPDTKTALGKLFSEAKKNGISTIRVSSSYRSYSTQESLFNSYVNNEKSHGLTTARAIEKANTYSAKPGHSEHQLGTTVDLMACKSPCSFYDSANNPLFSYLNANAHKFGFAISYPNGSQPYTGYVYEPWHVRYVGTSLATELYNRGYLTKKAYYLEQFLREKGRY